MLPGQNSNSYSTQGWLAQIYELLEGGVVGGNMQNGSIINGTAFFVTNTKPTTRIDGTALVTGDRWTKPDDGTEWFWNGTYWLSLNAYTSTTSRTGAFTAGTPLSPNNTDGSVFNFPIGADVFLEEVTVATTLGAAGDGSNHWLINVRRALTSGGNTSEYTSSNPITTSGYSKTTESLSVYVSGQSLGFDTRFFYVGITAVGTPPTATNINCSLTYRLEAP